MALYWFFTKLNNCKKKKVTENISEKVIKDANQSYLCFLI